MSLAAATLALLLATGPTHGQAPARNVIVVVLDGVRPSEVFTGAERALIGPAGGVENVPGCLQRYAGDSQASRREALMPFLWGTVAKQGQLFGDASRGSPGRVTNDIRLSYPGYNELLTGVADPRITSNEFPPNPNLTVFEWLAQRPALAGAVQAFATWDAFGRIFNVERSHLDVRAGWNPPFAGDRDRTSAKDAIDRLFRTTTPLFGGNALDAATALALEESLKANHPRLLFVGLGETDEWMHAGRYDLALEAIHRADARVEELWETLQSMPAYAGSTTLLVTTDHGRGQGPRLWRDHGREVEGSDGWWIAALGPGVPALGPRVDAGLTTEAQVAATIAALLGYDWRKANPLAAPPLPLDDRDPTHLLAGRAARGRPSPPRHPPPLQAAGQRE